MAPDPVARLSSEHAALVVLRPSRTEDVTSAGHELEAALSTLYRGLPRAEVTAWTTAQAVVAVVSIGQPTPSTRPAGLMWGLPVAPDGEPGDAAVTDALVDPSVAREWLGGFVLADLGRQRVRMVTGSDLRPTLRIAEGPAGTAFATRSLAAVVAAGRRPRVDRDRIAELVAFGAVLGDEELIADVRRLREGAVIDLDESDVTIGVVGSRGDRLAPGPASTPQQLRTSLGSVVQVFAAVPNLHLAMTGGRDSLLIASCAVERDVALPTFTFGPSPDATAAAAVAASLGWRHRQVGFGDGQRRLDEVVRLSCWTEGAVTAWDLAGPGLARRARCDVVRRDRRRDRPRVLLGPRGPAGGAGGIRHRTGRGRPAADRPPPPHRPRAGGPARTLGGDGEIGCRPPRRLPCVGEGPRVDDAAPPHALLRSTSAAYTSPAVTADLLDLPRSARRDGSGFDRALALGPPLKERAAQAVDPRVLPALQRAVRALRRRLRRRADPGGAALVAFARESQEDSIVRTTLGDDWWRWMVDNAPHDATARLRGWQAVAVDALERRIS